MEMYFYFVDMTALPGRYTFRMDPPDDVVITPEVSCQQWYQEERCILIVRNKQKLLKGTSVVIHHKANLMRCRLV